LCHKKDLTLAKLNDIPYYSSTIPSTVLDPKNRVLLCIALL
jgi:hypothetical protein